MMILWVDLETTGLDPNEHFLLEIAAYLTDSTLEIVDSLEHVFHFHWDATTCATLAGDDVFKMHTDNGLWKACDERSFKGDDGFSDLTVQQNIISMMTDAGCEPRTALLGGSTINFDRDWLLSKMPNLYNFLHYRNIDISGWKRAVDMWRSDLWEKSPRSNGIHRAGPDIIDSINYAKFFRDFVVLPQGQP